MSNISLFAADTLPTRLYYKTAQGAVIDITGYSFSVKIGYSPTPLTRSATIVTAAAGLLEIPWQAGDLVVGNYPIEMLVTNAAGQTKTHRLGQINIQARII